MSDKELIRQNLRVTEGILILSMDIRPDSSLFQNILRKGGDLDESTRQISFGDEKM